MAQLLDRAQPGELITVNKWNLVVDAVNQLLLARPTTGISLALSPTGTSDDPIQINALLQITGQGFGYSSGQTRVTFEGPFGKAEIGRAQMLTGSGDTRLLFIVPAIPGMSDLGLTMTLRVDSGIAQETRSVFVKPIVVSLTGDMFVTFRSDIANPVPNPLKTSAGAGPQTADFALQLQTGINLPAKFTLSADIRNASVAVPAGLVSSIEFRNENGSVITDKTVDMGTTDTRNIVVRIPDLPAAFAGQSFTLQVTAAAGGVNGTFSRPFTVGTTVQPPDPDVQPLLTGSLVLDGAGNVSADPANGQLTGTTITLKKDFQLIVMYNVKLTGAAGNFDLTIQPKQGTTLTGWSPQLMNTPTPIPGPTSARLVQFGVSPTGTPTQSGTVVFRIKRQGAATDWFQEFDVQLLP